MIIRLARLCVCTTLFVSSAGLNVTASDQDDSAFKITLRDADDISKVIRDDKSVVFDIRSDRGIGRATIERCRDSWPDRVIIRLHLSGLESFQVSNGTLTLHASVSSHDSPSGIRRWINDEEENMLDKESRYWMPVKLLDSDGKRVTKIPIKDGTIELRLPAGFLAGKPTEIEARWIDFHRG